jgi:O-antigen ligase
MPDLKVKAGDKFRILLFPGDDRASGARDALLWICLGLFPVFFLTIRGWTNGFLFLMFLVSIAHIRDLSGIFRKSAADPRSLAVVATLASGCIALLVSQTLRGGDFSLRAYDAPSRMLLAIPIFLVLKEKRWNFLRLFQYACPASLLFAVLYTWLFPHTWAGRPATYFADPITFGNYSMVMGFMCLFSLNVLAKDSRLLATLKLAGFASGVYLSILSQSRSGWLAAPVLLCIWLIIYRGPISRRIRFAIAGVGAAAALLAYYGLDPVHSRVNDALHDLSAWLSGENPDTSIGMRLEMWRVAFTLFMESPLYGYSDIHYRELLEIHPSLSAFASHEARFIMYGGLHNDILANTVRSGVFGLISALALFVVPAYIFVRCLSSPTARVHGAGAVGICLTSGLFVCSFGEQVFYLTFQSAFYGLMIATLCATALWKQR